MIAKLTDNSNIDRELWDAFVRASPQGSIFTYSWYIDVVAPGWQAIIVTHNDVWQAIMPLDIRKKFGFNYTLQPLLSRYWGTIMLSQAGKGNYDDLSFQKKVMEACISVIPEDLSRFNYYFSCNFNYPLPWKWKGFNYSSRFSYILHLNDLQDGKANRFSTSTRKKIDKATRAGLKIDTAGNTTELKNALLANEKAGKKIFPEHKFHLIDKIYAACAERGACLNLIAQDKEGNVNSAALLLKDHKAMYLLMGINQPAFRNSSSLLFMIDHVVNIARTQGLEQFDFLGSMMENIETFNRNFGTRPVPYYSISREKWPFSWLR